MYDFPPVMREQGRLATTAAAAKAYGSEHPGEFGGVHWANEPRVKVVFLATAHLDVHLRERRSRVPHPDRVEVRPCR